PDGCNRRDVADEIKTKIVVEGRVPRIRRRSLKQGITVGPRSYYRFGRDIACRARPVLNDELLAEPFRQPLRDEPCTGVEGAANGIADENTDRARGGGLRRGERGGGREGGQPRSQKKKLGGGGVSGF